MWLYSRCDCMHVCVCACVCVCAGLLCRSTTPLPLDMMQAALSVVASCASASSLTNVTDRASASNASAATASVAALLSAGALIGAVAGEPPVVIQTATISLSAQRALTATLANASSLTLDGSLIQIPGTIATDAFAGVNGSAVDSSLVQYVDNIYAFADEGGRSSTSAPVVSLTYKTVTDAGKSGEEVTVVDLSQPILLTFTHAPMAAAQCRFWNVSANAWSGTGCVVYNNGSASSNTTTTTCACTHLTAFNVGQLQELVVPPARTFGWQDILNFFDWHNIVAHPLPLITVGTLAALWALLTLWTEYGPSSVAQVEPSTPADAFANASDLDSKHAQANTFLTSSVNDDAPLTASAEHPFQWLDPRVFWVRLCLSVRLCCRSLHRSNFVFRNSTQSPAEFMMHKLAALPNVQDQEPEDVKADRGPCYWLLDPRIFWVLRSEFWTQMLSFHPILSVYYHDASDHFATVHRLGVVFTVVFSYTAVNALFYQQGDGSLSVSLAKALYALRLEPVELS
jgi:hypothetical protein